MSFAKRSSLRSGEYEQTPVSLFELVERFAMLI